MNTLHRFRLFYGIKLFETRRWGYWLLLLTMAFFLLQCTTEPTQPVVKQAKKQINQLAREGNAYILEGVQPGGALFKIWVPVEDWNHNLVTFAHGYVDPRKPVEIPEDQLWIDDTTYIPELINELGYAFAITSYRKNGLAIKEGVADLVELYEIFQENFGEPNYHYLTGASEGGAIATLASEQYAGIFDGGLPTCGPVGDFRKQIDYIGDFRVVFDYFFPGVIPGSPVDIPREVIDNWESVYKPRILDAIHADMVSTMQLLSVTKAAFDPTDPSTIDETVLGVLWYNVFATNDAKEELGGQPFDNMNRVYRGSLNDGKLNAEVQRFQADPAALAEIEAHYQTSGMLTIPVVNMHTIADPIVPYWHQPLYFQKVLSSGSLTNFIGIPIPRYGHCNFTTEEVLAAFQILVFMVEGVELAAIPNVLPDEQSRLVYRQLVNRYRRVQVN